VVALFAALLLSVSATAEEPVTILGGPGDEKDQSNQVASDFCRPGCGPCTEVAPGQWQQECINPSCEPRTEACPNPRANLTGVWAADDGGTYYIRHIGDTIWWAGLSRQADAGPDQFYTGLLFTNVFRGTINNSTNTIVGEWADVPRGAILQNGRLSLDIASISGGVELRKRAAETTGGFGGNVWRRTAVYVHPCETTASPLRCKFDVVRKNVGGTLLDGGDLKPYKDYVVVYGTVTVPLDLHYPPGAGRTYCEFFCNFNDDDNDGDSTFNIRVDRTERDNTAGMGLDVQPGFWTNEWVPGVDPTDILVKLDLHNNDIHSEIIMYGRTTNAICGFLCIPNPSEALLPGWMENGANSVLVNGKPTNGQVTRVIDFSTGEQRVEIQGKKISVNMRLRITGALVVDCGHTECSPVDVNDPGVEIHPVYSIDIINPSTRADLTGVWNASDVGTYYIRQIGESVWWLGLSRDQGKTFANIFHGTLTPTIAGGFIQGEWADIPLGVSVSQGTLSLNSPSFAELNFVSGTGGFGGRRWEKLYDVP
jgi:hypothetical protein